MYNEQYIDARLLTNKEQKIVGYDDKYRSGYIYFYDNNKILLIHPIDTVNIISRPCIKVIPNFIWHNFNDFYNGTTNDKIVDKNGYRYVIPELGDYLIINIRTGAYVGVMDQKHWYLYNHTIGQYYHPVSSMYKYDLKIEKYTGGMLDGYLYFKDSLDSSNLLQRINNNNIDDYVFNHRLEIYCIAYIQEQPRKVNESIIFNVPARKTRIGYDDSLLFSKDIDNIYKLDKVLPKNAIGYENANAFETEVKSENDNQMLFKWRGLAYKKGSTTIDLWVNGEKQPHKNYTINNNTKQVLINTLTKTKLYAKIYIKNIADANNLDIYGDLEPVETYDLINNNTIKLVNIPKPDQMLRIFINDFEITLNKFSQTNDIVTFNPSIGIMKGDIISIRMRYENGINQYNKYDPLGV